MAEINSIRRTLQRTSRDTTATPNTRRVALGLLAELDRMVTEAASERTRAQDLQPRQMVQSANRWYRLVAPRPDDSSDWARVWDVLDGKSNRGRLVLYNDEMGYRTR